MGKKVTSIAMVLIALAMVFVVMGCDNNTPAPALSGSGTETEPYEVASARALKELADVINAQGRSARVADDVPAKIYVKLTSDIDLGGEEWTPMGNAVRGKQTSAPTRFITDPTIVDFNGNGKKISDFEITTAANDPGDANENVMIGFFRGIGGGSKVYDLTFEDVTINSLSYASSVGVVAGGITGTDTEINNVAVTGDSSVAAYEGVGGIVGRIFTNGKVIDSSNAAAVSARNYNVGGIIGASYAAVTGEKVVITGNTNTGAVTVAADSTSAQGYAGGIVGNTIVPAVDTTLTGNTNSGVITGIGKTKVGEISGSHDTYDSDNTLSGSVVTAD